MIEKYCVEHVSYTPHQGINYTEPIDNTDTLLSPAELIDYYGDYCHEYDWLKLVDNETGEVVSTTEWGCGFAFEEPPFLNRAE